MGQITYHFAENKTDMLAFYGFVHECLVSEGYINPIPGGMFVRYPEYHDSDCLFPILAKQGTQIVGSTCFIKDSAIGLPEDKYFKEDIEAIRRQNRKIASVGCTLTFPGVRSQFTIIEQLFREIHLLVRHSGVNTMVTSANPKYEKVYNRLLHMQSISYCEKFNDAHIQAGAVLMRLDLENMALRYANPGSTQIKNFGAKAKYL